MYKECLDYWTANNGMNTYWQGLYYDTTGKIAAVKLKVWTDIDFSSSNPYTGKWWNGIEEFNDKWIYSNGNLAGTALNEGWAISQLQLYDVQQSLASGVKNTLILSLIIATLVLIITTKNLIVTILSMLTITSILGCTITVLIGEDWHLSILESVVFSVAVGLSVDFCVHYGWALLMALRANKDIERRQLIVASLKEMGGSVTMGSVTTIFAGCVMLLCSTLFFLRFGVFLIVCMSFSWFFSTLFLHATVSAIPSTKYLMDIDCGCLLKFCGFKKERVSLGAMETNGRGAVVIDAREEEGVHVDEVEMVERTTQSQ